MAGITERKKAEKELRAAYEQLAADNEELRARYDILKESRQRIQKSERDCRSIIENMQDAFYRTDLQDNLVMVSSSFAREFGYSRDEEVLGKNFRDTFCINPKDHEEFLKQLEISGEVKEHRITLRRKDGSTVVLSATSHFFSDETGKPAGVEGILRTMRDAVGAEEALLRANKKLSLLTGITRHDINNQLVVLNGYVGLLQTTIPDPAYKEYFSRITKASSQIAAMIRFTSEYEKIGTGSPVWQDLGNVLDRAETGILPGQITLQNDLPAGAEVYADPLIVRVLFNLLDNSLRHGQRVTEIQVTSHRCGEDLVVVWEDNGVGIPAKDKERIFERGFGKNTGLGMFLAREILSLTGIAIRETGDPGNGARFEMEVPKGMWREGGENRNVK